MFIIIFIIYVDIINNSNMIIIGVIINYKNHNHNNNNTNIIDNTKIIINYINNKNN